MPQYRVLKRSFIDNHIREEGDVVSYDGYPSENLEPMDDEGRVKQKEGQKAAKVAMNQLVKDVQPLGPAAFDQDAFAKAVAKAITDGVAAVAAGPKAKASPQPDDNGALT
jgi:hypothetical protein